MFVNFNGQLYRLIKSSLYFDGKPAIATDIKEKTDTTFSAVSDYFIKKFDPDDPSIQEIFDVDYFVVYDDKSETVLKKSAELNEIIKRGAKFTIVSVTRFSATSGVPTAARRF